MDRVTTPEIDLLGPGVGPYFLVLGFGFLYSALKTKKGTLLIPRLLLGLALSPKPEARSPKP